MIKSITLFWLAFSVFFGVDLDADLSTPSHSRIHLLMNPHPTPSLVNSVDFHPTKNVFCVTFTHNHSVVIYQLDEADRVSIVQVLQNDLSKLCCPQHALFSRDGKDLVVANWCNQTFAFYHADVNGMYQQAPISILPFPAPAEDFRPHGMAFSPDGNYLAVAYGASRQYPRAVSLYHVNLLGTAQVSLRLLDWLQGDEIEAGIPKGITFSPDGSCLLVTLAESNSVHVYPLDLSNERVIPVPRQVLGVASSLLSRPEDIKFTVDGRYFAVSNSDKDTVTFYSYDRDNNYVVSDIPSHIMENPEAQLCFPHGLAFSPDGNYLVVTQFGPVLFDEQGDLSSWGKERKDSVALFKIIQQAE